MKLLLLLFVPSLVFGACSVSEIVQSIRPGAEWSITDNDPSTLVWLSTQTIPSKAEILTAVQTCQTNFTARQALKTQARLDAKNTLLTPVQRLQAVLIILDLDQ